MEDRKRERFRQRNRKEETVGGESRGCNFRRKMNIETKKRGGERLA